MRNESDQVKGGLAMMAQLIEIIKPLIPTPSTNTGGGGNQIEMLGAVSAMSNKMLQENFSQQLNSQKDMMSTMKEMRIDMLAENNTETAPAEDDKIDKIVNVITSVLPMFLNSPAAVQKSLVTTARQTPEVKNVMQSKNKMSVLYSRLVAKFGEQKAKEIMQTFLKKSGGNNKKVPDIKPTPKPKRKQKTGK
jgi:hypothetical protein